MEQWVQKIGWKKASALLIALSVTALILIFFSSMEPSDSSVVNNITPSPSGNSEVSAPIPTTSQLEWKVYTSRTFEVHYPSGYIADSGARLGSMESLVLHPSDIGADINIQAYSAQSTSVLKISNIFSTLGYKQSPIIVGGVTGVRFSGSFSNDNIVREEAIVIETNGVIYKLQLTYASDVQDLLLEDTFRKIVAGFRLL